MGVKWQTCVQTYKLCTLCNFVSCIGNQNGFVKTYKLGASLHVNCCSVYAGSVNFDWLRFVYLRSIIDSCSNESNMTLTVTWNLLTVNELIFMI